MLRSALDLKTERDRFLDVFHRFLAGSSLAHATRNGRGFHHPRPVFIAIDHRRHVPQCITM